MRGNMAPRKKIKKSVKRKIQKPYNKKSSLSLNKRKNKASEEFKNIFVFVKKLSKAPFLLINLIINSTVMILKNIYTQISTIIKNIFNLFSTVKDALFSIIFGLLSGSIGAVLVFSYLEFSTGSQNSEYENKISENKKAINSHESSLEEKTIAINNFKEMVNELNDKINEINQITLENKKVLETSYEEINKLFDITKNNNDKILLSEKNNNNKFIKLEKKVQDTSTILLSSSNSELSNRIYLAQSLLDRLKSGVPYNPQLVALGKEGLHPALLRFAKGGAPTLTDLTARLTVRAGELRDAYKTKGDTSWKDSLKDEISKLVKIKPTNSADIRGMEGVLLRAEEAISKGNLEKAILEIDSLDKNSRGVLDAWLSEAKARKNASIAAENLLAKTTAALRNKE